MLYVKKKKYLQKADRPLLSATFIYAFGVSAHKSSEITAIM